MENKFWKSLPWILTAISIAALVYVSNREHIHPKEKPYCPGMNERCISPRELEGCEAAAGDMMELATKYEYIIRSFQNELEECRNEHKE